MAPSPINTAKRPVARSSKKVRLVLGALLVFAAIFAGSSSYFLVNTDVLPALFETLDTSTSGLIFNDKDLPDPTRMDVTTHQPTIPLRVVTFNIRYANNNPVAQEKVWTERGPKLINQLSFITAGHENGFLCLQEALHAQVQDISAGLGASWSYIGHGRDNGKKKGEFSPIFYRADVWTVERTEMRWLSDTPDRPSRGWGAHHYRIVTIGEFKHRVTGTKVIVMSTHFDYEILEARRNSAELILKLVKEWSHASNASAVLVGGDLNSTPDDVAYQLMTGPESGMSDVADLLPQERHFGNKLTYTSFGEPEEWPQRIDFLFLQQPTTAVVKSFGVMSNRFDDQVLTSDHRPVIADLEIKV